MAGARKERPPLVIRRLGYALGAAVNLTILYVLSTTDWRELSFLTSEVDRLVWLLVVGVLANVAANLLYVLRDPVWLKALGDVVTTGIGLALLVRIWQVFPFDLSGAWELGVRTVLVFGIAGCVIAILTAGITAARALHPDREQVSLTG